MKLTTLAVTGDLTLLPDRNLMDRIDRSLLIRIVQEGLALC